ncbi:MAG: DUF3152 domain-containing protein [Labedaea sp.]
MSRTEQGEQQLPRQTRSASTQRVARQDAGHGAAEPLTASRQPRAAAHSRARRKGVMRTYGWRVFALPVLLVLTALVVYDTVGRDTPVQAAGNRGGPDGAIAGEPSETGPPEVTEQPPTPVDVHVPTAELPPGGAFSQAGAGSWHVVPGKTDRVGTGGKLFTYTVEVEDGIDAASYGGDDAFARLIDQTLADPRGWTGAGQVSVQRVDSGTPTMRIALATPQTVHRPDQCGFTIQYESSCYRRSEQRVLINLARWVRGAVAFAGDMTTYRQYAINHEVGHAFNNGHVGCGAEGALAPVMMQQTFGVSNNFVAELNRADRNRDPVVADGKTCKPNAWPNPQAKPAG